jgi:hypothetical protein
MLLDSQEFSPDSLTTKQLKVFISTTRDALTGSGMSIAECDEILSTLEQYLLTHCDFSVEEILMPNPRILKLCSVISAIENRIEELGLQDLSNDEFSMAISRMISNAQETVDTVYEPVDDPDAGESRSNYREPLDEHDRETGWDMLIASKLSLEI